MPSEFEKDSVEIGNLAEVDCSQYYDIDSYADDMVCTLVEVKFDVAVTGAESQEDLDAVEAEYKNMADTGIENGDFQDSLDEVAPDSGWLVVEDRGGPELGAEETPFRTSYVPEEEGPEYTFAPIATYTPLKTRAKEDDIDEGAGIRNVPLWAIVVSLLMIFVLGILAGVNARYCFRRRNDGASSEYTDERLLT